MDPLISRLASPRVCDQDVEIVERKGLGHPDTVCDALAEELSLALCQFYRNRFDMILHHNVDKVLLWGGVAKPNFGGGEVIEPFEVFIAGRAILSHKGVQVPVEDLAQDACHRWLANHFHALDSSEPVKIHTLIRPGSSDLVELFTRQQQTSVYLANDTSCGVGYAPLTELERTVLDVENHLNAPATKAAYPQIGQDIKIMGVRSGNHMELTIACAMIDRHLPDIQAYLVAKEKVVQLAHERLPKQLAQNLSIAVNSADGPEANSIYLTVTGTSAEAGDDGEAGRGNRANGLITPQRPMTMESVAGKNPVSHVGKLYNIAAQSLAKNLVEEMSSVLEAHCLLVSRIGHPVNDPQIISVQVHTVDDCSVEQMIPQIRDIVNAELSGINELWKKVTARQLMLY